MKESIADKTGNKLQKNSQFFTYEQVLIVAALSMERMWMPFEIVGSKDLPELIDCVNQCMEMIWERVKCGKVVQEEKEKFTKLKDSINEIEVADPHPVSESAYANYLSNTIFQSTRFFWGTPDFRNPEYPFSIPINTLDMVIGYIGDLLPNLVDDEVDRHPSVFAEIARIDKDYQLVRNHPHNIDEILKQKEYYHNLLILEPYKEELLF